MWKHPAPFDFRWTVVVVTVGSVLMMVLVYVLAYLLMHKVPHA